jgi:hypothetical protein
MGGFVCVCIPFQKIIMFVEGGCEENDLRF